MALPTRVSRTTAADPFELAQRDFDHLLGRLFNGSQATRDGGSRPAPYGVDIREDQDHFYVEAELPGFKKDDIDITLERQTLTIAAERSEFNGHGNGHGTGEAGGRGELLLHERRYHRFLRSFTLPPTVNEQTVNAKLGDGVLTVTLNKLEETKPRKISVS